MGLWMMILVKQGFEDSVAMSRAEAVDENDFSWLATVPDLYLISKRTKRSKSKSDTLLASRHCRKCVVVRPRSSNTKPSQVFLNDSLRLQLLPQDLKNILRNEAVTIRQRPASHGPPSDWFARSTGPLKSSFPQDITTIRMSRHAEFTLPIPPR